MTRINSAIPVKCLTDEHLLAEHREIKRLPYCLRQAIQSGSIKRVPDVFRLGKGHVSFFLDKMRFIYSRYIDIYCEIRVRRFDVQSYLSNWADVVHDYWNDYCPTIDERRLLTERIEKRISESKKQTWHYYGHPITKQQAINLLVNKTINVDYLKCVNQ